MKYFVFGSILIIVFGRTSGSAQTPYISDKSNVELRMIIFYWDEKSWGQSESDTITFRLYKGQEFGDNNSASLFRLIDIIDNRSVKLQIPEGCQRLGKFPEPPDKNNPVIISGLNNYFRMDAPKSKVDYCIDLLKVNF